MVVKSCQGGRALAQQAPAAPGRAVLDSRRARELGQPLVGQQALQQRHRGRRAVDDGVGLHAAQEVRATSSQFTTKGRRTSGETSASARLTGLLGTAPSRNSTSRTAPPLARCRFQCRSTTKAGKGSCWARMWSTAPGRPAPAPARRAVPRASARRSRPRPEARSAGAAARSAPRPGPAPSAGSAPRGRDSRKLRCRCEVPAAPARSSCESPRRRRHQRRCWPKEGCMARPLILVPGRCCRLAPEALRAVALDGPSIKAEVAEQARVKARQQLPVAPVAMTGAEPS